MNFELESPYFLALLIFLLCFIWCKPYVKKFYFAKVEWIQGSKPFLNIDLWLKIITFTLLVFAMAKPFTYDSKINYNKKGRDLVLAIDASGSMGQSGFNEQNRFKTKFEINLELVSDFMNKRFDDNIGAVIFGTFAYTTAPLTYDLKALSYILKMVNVGIAGQSTAIGDAINQSLNTLSSSTASNKVIVLLTDGYHNAGQLSPKEAVKKAKKANIKIYTIGIGNKSDYDSALLEKISKDTNAKSFNASSAKELENIYNQIDLLEPSPIRSENYLNQKLLISYPLLLAFITILILYIRSKKIKLVTMMTVVISILIALSLYRPTMKSELQSQLISSNSAIIAIDVSYSMQAKDINPSRYEFSKQTIKEFLKLNPNINTMLIAFTSNPLLLSPPTTDHEILSIVLNSLNTQHILTKGTSLKNLFNKLSQLDSANTNIILITDGGDNEDMDEVSEIILNNNINLITLGVGTKQGITLDTLDKGKVTNNNGELIVARLNPNLKTMTNYVNGSYIKASTPNKTAAALTNRLNENINNEYKEVYKTQELYQVPLIIAIILFLMLHTKAIRYLIIIFAIFGVNVNANILDAITLKNSYNSYNNHNYSHTIKHISNIESNSLHKSILKANSYYKNGEFKKAIIQYKAIKSTNTDIKKILFYNIANSFMKLSNYKNAIIYYTRVLQIDEDKDALHNLEIAITKRNNSNDSVGIAHPKSQSGQTSKSESSNNDSDENKEDKPSSGSGGAGEGSSNENVTDKQLLDDGKSEQIPLSSKVYELINKGYIREKNPW